MSADPLTFFAEALPATFARGMAALEARNTDRAQRILDDIRSAKGAMRLQSEEGDELWLSVQQGTLTATRTRPADVRVRFALAAPRAALAAATADLKATLADENAAVRLASAASARVESLLEPHVLRFHVIVAQVPDLGDVRLRAAVHADEPPETADFSATVRFDDLEALREGSLNPQQLLMGGKVRLSGNYASAFQVGMQLMQRAP